MKITYLTLGCAAILASSGCLKHRDQASVTPPTGWTLADEGDTPSRLESIAYDWETYRVRVTFYRQARNGSWTMTIRDAWDVREQSTASEGKVWGLSESRCSTEQCLGIINRSFALFHVERPNARLAFLAFEMQINQELWGEISAGLTRRLSALDGVKPNSRIDVPSEIDEEIGGVVDKSPVTAAMTALLRKHGMHVQSVGLAEHVLFKDSLAGKKWSDIAILPGAGVLVPGTVEFALSESK